MERRHGVPAGPHRWFNRRARELTRQFEEAPADPATPADRLTALLLEAKRPRRTLRLRRPLDHGTGLHEAPQDNALAPGHEHRRQAAEMAGDMAAPAAEAETLQGRCRPARRDDAWPSGRDDRPNYPSQEPKSITG
jgi:hypothetical protein